MTRAQDKATGRRGWWCIQEDFLEERILCWFGARGKLEMKHWRQRCEKKALFCLVLYPLEEREVESDGQEDRRGMGGIVITSMLDPWSGRYGWLGLAGSRSSAVVGKCFLRSPLPGGWS